MKFQNSLGSGFCSDSLLVFFGNAKSEKTELLEKVFPKLSFKKIKQTHSNIVVAANNFLTEADAHYTSEKNTALLISTADCLPIIVYCQATERVGAIHAGWKGVANKITEKLVEKLLQSGSTPHSLQFWVGPHIQQKSFEINPDVLQVLLQSGYNLQAEECFYSVGEKFYVNLSTIIKSQLKNTLSQEPNILFSQTDTMTDLDYCSYRRGKEIKARNLSFVAALA